ncbi:tetratricopeptide repeat protein [Roseateles violae]|uniref:NB-ARC domain-containing protein n=1 Tax=Roseateles violae TaxID=3058042 RepID=A0ABT8DXQ9_9BURK|nr:tetratricopeptide repeat protein [Pelomonas sp. PFR6]MDN3921722.1 NB-ARC domain-containing protein [Pelomonas sp. PFR6]
MKTDTRASRIKNLIQIGELHGPLELGEDEEDEEPIPEPELRQPLHDIVGRSPLVAEVLAGIDAGQRDFAFEFLAGVGKTTLAAELIRDPALRSRFDGVLWAHLGQTPDVRSELLKWAEAVGLDETAVAKRKTDGELGRAIASRFGKRRLLLIIDDVWTSEHGQLFMLGGKEVRRVLTSRKRGVARELSPNARVLVVPKLSPADSLLLLRALAQDVTETAEAEDLAALVERVDGLPLALVMMGKMLRNMAEEEAPVRALLASLRDIGQMFKEKKPIEFTENLSRPMAEVIEAGYEQLGSSGLLDSEQLDGDMLRAAVTALSVLRPDPQWFDETLAQAVTGVSRLALCQLAQAGMIERRQSAEGQPPRYTMHRVIAEFLRSKLEEEQLKALNTRAADYFLAQLSEIEEVYQKRTQYLALYRYENPVWREAQDNWLYHFAQAGYNPRASLAFLRVWLTAFWWWSCFTDKGFDFCDQLLDEWEHRLALSAPETASAAAGGAPLAAQSGERIHRLREGLELLRRFKKHYPKETAHDRGGEGWTAVQEVLDEMRQRTGLAGDPPEPANVDGCVVRGFSSIFLAEAARFGRRDFETALGHYADALACFEAIGDAWNSAWVNYHQADMLAGCGRLDDAKPLCEQALQLGTDQGDPEVIALAQRVLGDIALSAGDIAEAGRRYQAAVENAYRFQIEPEPPDDYTIGFYPELAEDVAAALLRLHGERPAEAQALAQALREPWLRVAALPAAGAAGSAPFDADARSLAAWLFPPPLDSDQLADRGQDYGERVGAHLALLPLKTGKTP